MNEAPAATKTQETVITPDTSIPPKLIKRNEHGLINADVNYIYSENGLIDWRAMINPKHLAVNKDKFIRNQRPVPTSISGLNDYDLLILLAGIKELAYVRGFSSVTYLPISSSKDSVVASCKIKWIPNFETEGREVTFSAMGDANPTNTNGFGGVFYLSTIAENRAFVRAVRNFLRINIVSQDEISQANPIGSTSQTVDANTETLANTMQKYGVTFEKIKETLVKECYPDADKLEHIGQIDDAVKFQLIGRMNKKAKEKEKSKV